MYGNRHRIPDTLQLVEQLRTFLGAGFADFQHRRGTVLTIIIICQ